MRNDSTSHPRGATWWPATLAGRLSVVLAAFILLGTAVVLGVEYVRGRDALLREATQSLQARDRLVVERLDGALRARRRLVSLWPELGSSQDLAIEDLDKRVAASLVELAGTFGAGDLALAVAPSGRIIAASDRSRIGGTVAGAGWFDPRAGEPPADSTALRLSTGTSGWLLVATSPVRAATTRGLLGWIVLTTPWRAVEAEVAGEEARLLVVRDDGGRIVSRGDLVAPDTSASLWAHQSTVPVAGLRLDAAMAQPVAQALRPLRDTGRQLGVFAVVVLLLTIPATLLLVRSTTGELSRLTAAARAVPEEPSPGGLRVSDGAPREVRVLADALGTMVERLEESRRELARQASLAAMGTMAAGLAHEIRTPLSVLRGSAQMLSKRSEDGTREAELISFMEDEVDRLSRLVDDLLVFARPREPDLVPVDLADVARRAASALQPRLDEAGLELEADLGSAPLLGDSQQLYQVVLNLLANASRASRGGQRLHLATAIEDGATVLRVEDHGQGIPVEHLDRIWDPFFTTGNGGTGLGLPIVRRIVEEHGGRIVVESEVGVGTQVTARFPHADLEGVT